MGEGQVRVWTLAEALADPKSVLDAVMKGLDPTQPKIAAGGMPAFADISSVGSFLEELRNRGMQPKLAGDIPVAPASAAPERTDGT
uniref:CAZy families GT14 protein n=1 Tax=uncultured Rhodobacter sp. TaxID=204728 RepID=A0A060CCV9_9RHOB|nr:CAZy families GT14 protein [uncultured Rhodobacter sp.]